MCGNSMNRNEGFIYCFLDIAKDRVPDKHRVDRFSNYPEMGNKRVFKATNSSFFLDYSWKSIPDLYSCLSDEGTTDLCFSQGNS